LRTQEGTISTPPASAAVVGPEDRRRQEVSLQAAVEAEAEVVRQVPDRVGGVAAVRAAVQAAAEAEVAVVAVEFSPVLPLTPRFRRRIPAYENVHA
jgi:hypothetical protein